MWDKRVQKAWWLVAGILLAVLPSVAQMQVGDKWQMNLGGNIGYTYNGNLNQGISAHSMGFSGDANLHGSYYNPNFLNFSARVRGVAGEFLTADLVQRLGRAAVAWSGARTVFVGRDTRASGVELESALAEGIASAGATAIMGGVLPSGAVALASLEYDLGVVITASHNPPEYNGVKFFRGEGKLSDADEEAIEA